jgi:hypothetical protein
MPPQPDAASGHEREQKLLAVLAAAASGNVSDGLRNNVRQTDAGKIAGALRHVGVLVAEGVLGAFGVKPSAFPQVVHPHTIILSASARSRCFLMPMAATASNAVAAITIQMRDLICISPFDRLG